MRKHVRDILRMPRARWREVLVIIDDASLETRIADRPPELAPPAKGHVWITANGEEARQLPVLLAARGLGLHT